MYSRKNNVFRSRSVRLIHRKLCLLIGFKWRRYCTLWQEEISHDLEQNSFIWGYPSKHLIRPFPNHLSLPNILSYTLVLVLNVGMQLETIVEQIITSEQVQTWNLFSNSSSHFSSRLPIYYIVVESINIYQILELTCKTSIRYTVS